MAQPSAKVSQFEPSDECQKIIAEATAALENSDVNTKLAFLKSYAERATHDAQEHIAQAAEAQYLYSCALFAEYRLEDAVIAQHKATELEPQNPNYHAELAQFAFAAEQFTPGREACARALIRFKELAKENPEEYEPNVAKMLHVMGEICWMEERKTEASRAYEQALALSQTLAATNPKDHEPRLASIFNSLGRFYFDQNQKKKSLNAYTQALAIRQKLAEADPDAYEPQLAETPLTSSRI